MIFEIATLINDGEGRFSGYEDGDKLVIGPRIRVNVAAPSPETAYDAACDEAFEIGNRMKADIDGNAWPSDVRSLSVGDVLVFTDGNTFVVDSLGFAPFPSDSAYLRKTLLLNSILFGKVSSRGASATREAIAADDVNDALLGLAGTDA